MRPCLFFLLAIGALVPRAAFALSVDWSCSIGAAYLTDKKGHLSSSAQYGHLAGSNFIVDFDSGRIFGGTLLTMERLLSTTVISKAYKDGDYLVAYNAIQATFLDIQASSGQEQKPFKLFDGSTGTLFTGRCVFGAANNSFKPKPLRGSA
jgi:hypothetical protein